MIKRFIQKIGDMSIQQYATKTMSIPAKYTSYGLMLQFKKVDGSFMTAAEIQNEVDEIKVTLNDKVVGTIDLVNTDARSLIDFDNWQKAAKSDYILTGLVPIDYLRERLPLLVAPESLAIGMLNMNNYILSVKFGNLVLTIDQLTVYNIIDKLPARPVGEFCVFRKWQRTFGNTGIEIVDNLPYGEDNTGYLSYHVFDPEAVIDYATVEYDGVEVYQELTDNLNDYLSHVAGRTPQPQYFSMDFQRREKGLLSMQGVKSFRNKLSWNPAAGAPSGYAIYTDMIHNLQAQNF